jgi:hypothetical protein
MTAETGTSAAEPGVSAVGPQPAAGATAGTDATPAARPAPTSATRPALAPVAPTSRLPGWAAWAIGAGLIVIAWFVALVTPGEEQAQAPFVVAATLDEPAVGRNLAVTITDVRRAPEVSAADGWAAEGNWLVVDLQAESFISEGGVISHAMVQIDGVQFSASDRPDSLLDAALTAGIPQTGSLAFELPEDLTAGAARLELALATDVRLDSMIVLSFDLAEVPFVDDTELIETGWANP